MFKDLHSHILSGIDDGSENFGMSVDMIRIAIEEGIDTIMATPHFIAGLSFPEQSLREEAYVRLKDYIEENHLPIRLILGNEIYLDEQCVSTLMQGRCLPLGSSRYVLLEFSLSSLPINLESTLEKIQHYGYWPILAHPERCSDLMSDKARLEMLLKQGILFQVNTGSVTGFYGPGVKKAAKKLFECGQVHFIGTDAHTNRTRSPRMIEAYHVVGRWVGIENANSIFLDNPRFILEDLPFISSKPAYKTLSDSLYSIVSRNR